MTESNSALHDGYVAVLASQVTDLALLPQRFDLLAGEVKSGFELLGNKIMTAIDRHDQQFDAQTQVNDLVEKRIAALEALVPKKHRRASKRKRKAKR